MDNYRKGSYIAGTFISARDAEEDQTDADIEKFRRGLEFAQDLAKSHGWSTIWLLTETARDLMFDDISGVLSSGQIETLRKGRPVSLGSLQLRHATRTTMQKLGVDQVILAEHPTEKILNQLDQYHREHAVIVVPWHGEHVREWAETWGAVNTLPGGEEFQRPSIDDPVVREQLNDLVNASNHGGLTYPSDLPMFREMFKRLKKEGHRFTVSAVRSFVIVESYRGVDVAEKIAKAAAPHALREKARPVSEDA